MQNKFLSFLCYCCNIPRVPPPSYAPILDILFLDPLELCKIKFDLHFLYSTVHNITLMVPQRLTRSHVTFYISSQRTNYVMSELPYYATNQYI